VITLKIDYAGPADGRPVRSGHVELTSGPQM
jgi:hypothetical protein